MEARRATWRSHYSALSDADIATSRLTRQELDIRATLQVEVTPLVAWLTARYPNDIGPVWLDSRGIVVSSTNPEAMSHDPDLVAYPHRDHVAVVPAAWSERRIDATFACLGPRLATSDPAAQVRLYTAAGELGIEAADNDAGRAALRSAYITEEVAASQGVLLTNLHPVERPRTV